MALFLLRACRAFENDHLVGECASFSSNSHGHGTAPFYFIPSHQPTLQDLGITATTDMLKLAKGDVSGEAALDYKLGDATLGCNVEYGAKGLKGQFATQYNGGDWNAVLKSNCADGKFANVVGYKHSLGFVAKVNKDTQIFGSVGQGKEGQEVSATRRVEGVTVNVVS